MRPSQDGFEECHLRGWLEHSADELLRAMLPMM